MIQTSLIHTDIDAALLAKLAACLSVPEMNRADRFHQHQDRKNYIVAHAALRLLLAKQLNLPHHDLQFTKGRWGKPMLAQGGNTPLHFNLSHSGNMVLIAIATQPVGIDIEFTRPLDYTRLAGHCFAAEEALRIVDSHSFFEHWTAKEAVIKASGRGWSEKTQQFIVPAPSIDLQPIRLLQPNPSLEGLHVARLTVGKGYYAALSAAPTSLPVQLNKFAPAELI
ncbi:4'-phosphopantetheinyl transferase superfamily protein [Pollutimonas bauzanensis]|uniref:4'-phosphopantetheinyl transferase family protein n=1 Tax=Pollutimonas bauzanensis TaxID=658167 RepID=UPI00333F62A7